jgi:hypothetical protein
MNLSRPNHGHFIRINKLDCASNIRNRTVSDKYLDAFAKLTACHPAPKIIVNRRKHSKKKNGRRHLMFRGLGISDLLRRSLRQQLSNQKNLSSPANEPVPREQNAGLTCLRLQTKTTHHSQHRRRPLVIAPSKSPDTQTTVTLNFSTTKRSYRTDVNSLSPSNAKTSFFIHQTTTEQKRFNRKKKRKEEREKEKEKEKEKRAIKIDLHN